MDIDDRIRQDCIAIAGRSPLVHCISNYVAMDFNANALLALKASPFMSFCPEEMEETAGIADVLVVNLGCLDSTIAEASTIASENFRKMGKPWVLDPVGAGATSLRTGTAVRLVSNRPDVIRGNASEISAIASALSGRPWKGGKSRGADSSADTEDVLDEAMYLARKSGSIVSMSGATDIITDGDKVIRLTGGCPQMCRITGMGCTASVITGACLATFDDRLTSATKAMEIMGAAGEKAFSVSGGTASMKTAFIDILSNLVK